MILLCEVLRHVVMNSTFFWGGVAVGERTCCLHLLYLCPEDGGRMFLSKVENFGQEYLADVGNSALTPFPVLLVCLNVCNFCLAAY